MFSKAPRGMWWVRETAIAVAILLLGLFVTQAFGVEPPKSRKMERQIDVLERIVDQVLIDSPNFLVSGRGTTRGLYLGDYGVVFTFSASLLEKGSGWKFDFGEGFRVEHRNGKEVIVLPWGDDEDEDRDQESDELDDTERDVARRIRDRHDSRQERLYSKGKAEIVDVFLDYGDTMTTLKEGQWVAIVAFLEDSSFLSERHISRLVLKAKIEDLRAFAAEKISEEELVKRIVEEEY